MGFNMELYWLWERFADLLIELLYFLGGLVLS